MMGRRRGKRLAVRFIIPVVLLVAILLVVYYKAPHHVPPPPPPVPVVKPPAPPSLPAPAVRPEVAMPAGKAQRAQLFFERGWNFTLGESREAIIAKLGRPLHEHYIEVVNNYSPQKDRVYTLEYDGLTAETYHVTHMKTDHLVTVRITAARYPVLWGLNVGGPLTKVTQTLGTPKQAENGDVTYEDENDYGRLEFHARQGIVTRIDWYYYMD